MWKRDLPGLAETLAGLPRTNLWARMPQSDTKVLSEVGDFGANPGQLDMRMYAPADLPAGAALVVVLHGCGQTADGYAEGAGWVSLAERHGFALLCPQQRRSNNANLCFNWFQPDDVQRGDGEAASIRAMVADAVKRFRLDPGRVFITGLSAGGAMANVMMAAYPEAFQAGAVIAGLPYGAASDVRQALAAMRGQVVQTPRAWGDQVRDAHRSARRWPRVSIWQGDADTTVTPAVARQIAAQWCDVHDLQGSGEASSPSEGHRRAFWRDRSGETLVELHQIAGMGHGTALGSELDDGCGAPGPYLLEVGVASSVEIARSWGLINGPRPQSQRPSSRPAAPRLGAQVSQTVAEALRRAGLPL